MSGRYEERYNEKRPVLGFRVSPEVKDRLYELQDGSGKTISEIAENVLADALASPNKNHSSNRNGAYSNGYKNGVADGKQPNVDLYENGFKNGHKTGSNHAKNEIKNRIKTNSQKTKDDLNKQIKKYLKDNESDCSGCGGTFLYADFDFCPYCGIEFDRNAEFNDDSELDFSHIRIPIVSDILDLLTGGNEQVAESSGEESRREDSSGEDAKLNFVGGSKFIDQPKKDDEDDDFACQDCDAVLTRGQAKCPGCGKELDWANARWD